REIVLHTRNPQSYILTVTRYYSACSVLNSLWRRNTPLCRLILLTTGHVPGSILDVIETRGRSAAQFGRLGQATYACRLIWAVVGWLSITGIHLQAGPLVNTDSPIGFFTNVADPLLQSQ